AVHIFSVQKLIDVNGVTQRARSCAAVILLVGMVVKHPAIRVAKGVGDTVSRVVHDDVAAPSRLVAYAPEAGVREPTRAFVRGLGCDRGPAAWVGNEVRPFINYIISE